MKTVWQRSVNIHSLHVTA